MATNNNHIDEIDGLRAVAVISVILFHLKASLLPGGFSGVDVFFVISGYVVCGSLAKQNFSDFWKFILDFYARRILRIYPALVTCLVVTTILQVLFVPQSWLSQASVKTGLFAFLGLSNFALIWFNDGYFSPRVEFNAFTHTWSLAVEEQFYLLFPILFYVWIKGFKSNTFIGGVYKNLILILLLASSLIAIFQTSSDPDKAYYLLPSRFWELAAGALLYILHFQKKLVSSTKSVNEITIALGLILIMLGFIYASPNKFPFPWALMPVLGTLLTINGVVSTSDNKPFLNSLLNNKWIVYIGKLSFSLYLWHWPIIVIFRWTVGIDKPETMFAVIVFTVVLSIFSFHFVEQRFRKTTFITSKTNQYIFSRGITTIFLLSILTAGIFKAQPFLSLSVTSDQYNWYANAHDQTPISNHYKSVGSPFQNHTLYVLGDSHAGAYSTMLNMLEQELGVNVKIYSKGGCPVANLLSTSPDCSKDIQENISKIKREAIQGDIVFLASLRMNRLADQWTTFDDSVVQEAQSSQASLIKRNDALQQAKSIIEDFQSVGLTVLIDAPKPIFKSPPFRCSDWFNSKNPICNAGTEIRREFLLNHREPAMLSLSALKKQNAKLVVWDPFPILCPTETCSAFDNNIPIFFDADHLSGHGNRILYPSFNALIKSVWKQ